MKKTALFLLIVFMLISCGSLIQKAIERTGILEDKAYVEYKSSETKKIAFIYMRHVGTDLFYKNVAQIIDSLQNNSYISFYENVGNNKETDSIEEDKSMRKTRKIYGIIPEKYYDSISNKIVGKIKYKGDKKLINQPSYSSLGVDTLTAVKADVELKSMIREFESRYGEIELSDCDYNTSIDSKEYDCDLIEKELGKKFREEIILDYRNEFLANQIINHNSKKILVIYGANHFKGLWKELHKIDSTWQYDDTFPDYRDRKIE